MHLTVAFDEADTRLRVTRHYDVESIDVGPLGSASGADLMADGIEIGASQSSAAHVLALSARPR